MKNVISNQVNQIKTRSETEAEQPLHSNNHSLSRSKSATVTIKRNQQLMVMNQL